MRTVKYASVVEISGATTVKLEVRGGVKGTGRLIYSEKCWDNAVDVERMYKNVKHFLKSNGYEPVMSEGCYEVILYWKRVIE